MHNTPDTGPMKLSCPICKKLVLWNEEFPHRPFCSDRCRLIDLGEWASEGHRIAGEPLNKMNDTDNADEF